MSVCTHCGGRNDEHLPGCSRDYTRRLEVHERLAAMSAMLDTVTQTATALAEVSRREHHEQFESLKQALDEVRKLEGSAERQQAHVEGLTKELERVCAERDQVVRMAGDLLTVLDDCHVKTFTMQNDRDFRAARDALAVTIGEPKQCATKP